MRFTTRELLHQLGHREITFTLEASDEGVAVWTAVVRSLRRVVYRSSSQQLALTLEGLIIWLEGEGKL